jgi:hypothetical protein
MGRETNFKILPSNAANGTSSASKMNATMIIFIAPPPFSRYFLIFFGKVAFKKSTATKSIKITHLQSIALLLYRAFLIFLKKIFISGQPS